MEAGRNLDHISATSTVGIRARLIKGKNCKQDEISKRTAGTVRLLTKAEWSMPKVRLRASIQAQFLVFLGSELYRVKGDSLVTGFL